MEEEIKKNRKYDIIYADPPWDLPFVREHYDVMTPDQLKKLPVPKICKENSLLFMWAIANRLVEAIELMNHWGFYYMDTAFVWIKLTSSNKLHFGLGKTSTRRSCEFVLLGARYGSSVPERKSKAVPQVFFEKMRIPFSRKPDIVRKMISDLFHHNSKIELFARKFPDSKYTENWTLCNKTIIQNAEEKEKKKRRVDSKGVVRYGPPAGPPSGRLGPSFFRDAKAGEATATETPSRGGTQHRKKSKKEREA